MTPEEIAEIYPEWVIKAALAAKEGTNGETESISLL